MICIETGGRIRLRRHACFRTIRGRLCTDVSEMSRIIYELCFVERQQQDQKSPTIGVNGY